MSTDWNKYFKERQHLDENLFQPKDFDDVYQSNTYYKDLWLRKQRIEQLRIATGLGTCAFLTKFGFAYLGGMYQARKQFINSPLYFRNHYYNWIGGLKYIGAGLLVGTLLSTFAFGHPYLLEDWVRSKFRGLTTAQYMEKGYRPM
jgi:hypothetical protein